MVGGGWLEGGAAVGVGAVLGAGEERESGEEDGGGGEGEMHFGGLKGEIREGLGWVRKNKVGFI